MPTLTQRPSTLSTCARRLAGSLCVLLLVAATGCDGADPSGSGPVGPPADTTPPRVLSAQAVGVASVSVAFDEALTSASVTTSSFRVDGVGTPSTASYGDRVAVLSFADPLPAGDHAVTVRGVRDLAGNALESGTARFAVVARTSRVRITLGRFHVVGDCDGGLNGAGEFHLYAAVNENGSGTMENVLDRGYTEDANDDTLFEIDESWTAYLPQEAGSEFSVYFRSYESDVDGLDPRMDDVRTTRRHTWSPTGWTNLQGPGTTYYIRHGEGACRATLSYRLELD